jgi:hypothetical protein
MPIKVIKRLIPNDVYWTATKSRPGCPDILETEAGDFLIIGDDVTDVIDFGTTGAIISPGERIVKIPRKLLLSIKETMPNE